MFIHSGRKYLLLAALLCFTQNGAAAGTGVDLLWGEKIPMRDGIKLNATVYKPKDQKEPLPVIFTLTPYISDSYHDRAFYFSQNGYVFVLVDARGRGSSEGEFTPFMQEAEDGHDIVEWLAKQEWSNGKTAMWGGSYAGYDQWATAKELPPHLTTIVPAASAYPGTDFPMWKNIPYPYDMQWLTLTSGKTLNGALFAESAFWVQKYRERYLENRPFKELDQIIGNLSTKFQTWVAHPMIDEYWDAMNPTAEQLANIDIPILTITGHYDGDQPGAMKYYKRHMRHASRQARNKHYLIAGPWDHPGTRTPQAEFAGWKFGEASVLDLNALHKEWYDWTMKNGKKPAFLKKRVAYFVAGANEWKYADTLEDISNDTLVLYLDSDGRADSVFHSGMLKISEPNGNETDSYVYDPLDLRPAELETEFNPNYIVDQRKALHLDGDGLIYHSEAFDQATEVSGYIKFTAWMAMDVPDTDFMVNVYEVLPDGTSLFIAQDMLRARYRESLREAKPVTPGEITRYEFDGFYFISRKLAKGSRLRLMLTAPNSIYWQKNYNSGGVVAEESADDARPATIRLYHTPDYPSRLELPLVN
ncbi:MAG: CocE/NonD family hydrolase [Gammaproteobacteria bacterium]|nr:CocE/NonD family hydrolase [Gammaproteobacteria bacterium]